MKIDVEGAWSIVAFCGGVARYLFNWMKLPQGSPFGACRMLATGAAAGFTGLMTGSVVVLMGHPTWALVAAGIGGFMGTESMELLFDIAKRRTTPKGEQS